MAALTGGTGCGEAAIIGTGGVVGFTWVNAGAICIRGAALGRRAVTGDGGTRNARAGIHGSTAQGSDGAGRGAHRLGLRGARYPHRARERDNSQETKQSQGFSHGFLLSGSHTLIKPTTTSLTLSSFLRLSSRAGGILPANFPRAHADPPAPDPPARDLSPRRLPRRQGAVAPGRRGPGGPLPAGGGGDRGVPRRADGDRPGHLPGRELLLLRAARGEGIAGRLPHRQPRHAGRGGADRGLPGERPLSGPPVRDRPLAQRRPGDLAGGGPDGGPAAESGRGGGPRDGQWNLPRAI